jgi:uncharacterized protein YciI
VTLWIRILFATGSPDEVAAHAPAHREHLRELDAAGKLRVSGELARDLGYVDVIDVRDRREAEALLAASPLVEAGVCSYVLKEMGTLFFSAPSGAEKDERPLDPEKKSVP